MPDWLLAVLTFLAVHRASRLLTADAFPPVARLRQAIADRSGPDGALTYLFGNPRRGSLEEADDGCPWCMSLWVGIPIVWGVDAAAGLPLPVLWWAAASTATGFLAQLEAG